MGVYAIIIFRTCLLYVIIVAILRLMGKREIGELSILDVVVFIMIAEIAALAIEKHNTPILQTIIPILLLTGIQIFSAILSIKSIKFRHFMDGRPTIIINKGKIDEKAMRSQRYNFDDLLLQLREKDIHNIADVEFAVLETTGKLSVFQKDKNNKTGEFTIPLIMDGFIQYNNLAKKNKDEAWLRKQLAKRGYHHIEEISFCSYQNGQFFIDMKDENI